MKKAMESPKPHRQSFSLESHPPSSKIAPRGESMNNRSTNLFAPAPIGVFERPRSRNVSVLDRSTWELDSPAPSRPAVRRRKRMRIGFLPFAPPAISADVNQFSSPSPKPRPSILPRVFLGVMLRVEWSCLRPEPSSRAWRRREYARLMLKEDQHFHFNDPALPKSLRGRMTIVS